MTRRAKSLGRRPNPEYRLWLSHLGFVTVMIGLIVFGVQLQNATPMQWNVTPIVGAGIAAFGNQIVTTVLITCKFLARHPNTMGTCADQTADAVDCHPGDGASVGGFVALVRQTWGFVSKSISSNICSLSNLIVTPRLGLFGSRRCS